MKKYQFCKQLLILEDIGHGLIIGRNFTSFNWSRRRIIFHVVGFVLCSQVIEIKLRVSHFICDPSLNLIALWSAITHRVESWRVSTKFSDWLEKLKSSNRPAFDQAHRWQMWWRWKKETKRNKPIINTKTQSYIISSVNYPLPQNRWGYLPVAMQLFFKSDANRVIDPKNNNLSDRER